MTRAADSKDLLSMISFELPACSPECPDSFFIGMMAEELVTAQLVASRVASRPLPSSSSLPPHSQEVVPNLQSSQRTFSWSSCWWYFLCVVAFLGAANFVNNSFVNFKIYGFFLSAMLLVGSSASPVRTLLLQQHLCPEELWDQLLPFSFGEFVANKLAKHNAQHQPQNPRTAFSFITNNLISISFVYPMLGNKVAFNLLADLSGVGSFGLSR